MDYLLGIDVGSTSMKAAIYDLDGNVVSQASRPSKSISNEPEHPNWQVYIPDDVWNGVAAAIKDAVQGIESADMIVPQQLQDWAQMRCHWMIKASPFTHSSIGCVLGQHPNLIGGWKLSDWKKLSRFQDGSHLFGVQCFASSGFKRMNLLLLAKSING